MNSDIEQILLAQAALEAEQAPKLSDMVALGAGSGAVLGALAGTPVDAVGRQVGKLRGTNRWFKPGGRMAGALILAGAGGALGAGIQRQIAEEAGTTGALLAKIQAQGGMTIEDQMNLEAALKTAYSQQGLLG